MSDYNGERREREREKEREHQSVLLLIQSSKSEAQNVRFTKYDILFVLSV